MKLVFLALSKFLKHFIPLEKNYVIWGNFISLFYYVFLFFRHASECDSYDLVLTAARYYWNNICSSLSTPIERQLLQEPIKSLLSYINKVSKKTFEDFEEVSDLFFVK